MKNKDKMKKNKKTDEKIKNGDIPGTFSNQNLGHNAKKTGLGPNTNR